jgi:hypothetical protein
MALIINLIRMFRMPWMNRVVAAGLSAFTIACDKGETGTQETGTTEASTATDDSDLSTNSDPSTPSDVENDVQTGCDNLEPSRKGDFMVVTDEELREFEGVACIDGMLFVYESVSHLTPLEALQKVKYLEIHRTPLRSLSGLDNLTTVVGSLVIDGIVELESLDALSNLTTIGSELIIGIRSGGVNHKPEDGNDKLTSLHGLEGLRRVESIYIESNDSLVDVSALDGIASSLEDIAFFDNTMLAVEDVETLATTLGVTLRQCGCLGEPLCPADGD